jgi:Fic family protein
MRYYWREYGVQYYLLPEREIEMRYRATVEATHNSTSIEGNPLTLKQVDAVLFGKELTRHAYDVLNLYGLAMQGLLPNGKIGVFRRNNIFIVDQDDRVKYTGPDAKHVRKLVHDLLGWLEAEGRELHPCLAAAILHYQIVTIHPFSDGNGRIARLMVTLLLGQRDYDFRGTIILDSHYAADKPAYYTALHKCQGKSYREDADITFILSRVFFPPPGYSAQKSCCLPRLRLRLRSSTFAGTTPIS